MIKSYTQHQKAQQWLNNYQGKIPIFACILGFTETGLIEGISAAGATPKHRQYTALADAEFLVKGPQPDPTYPLPPLAQGASPVLISRAVVEMLSLPVYVFNAGLTHSPSIETIDLGGKPAQCLTTGKALPLETVHHLFQQGLHWGERLAHQVPTAYLILGECVVGGTTTALSLLMALGIDARGQINSSHPQCNHQQKWQVVKKGLEMSGFLNKAPQDPLEAIAALGDPMQITTAGMAIAASRTGGVLLAGGTQMLAVYALVEKIATHYALFWQPEKIIVGTTRWVIDDPTGKTIALAHKIGTVPLLGAQLDFSPSRLPQLQAYEQGYVKEGVGAGGCAIASNLAQLITSSELLESVEKLASQLRI